MKFYQKLAFIAVTLIIASPFFIPRARYLVKGALALKAGTTRESPAQIFSPYALIREAALRHPSGTVYYVGIEDDVPERSSWLRFQVIYEVAPEKIPVLVPRTANLESSPSLLDTIPVDSVVITNKRSPLLEKRSTWSTFQNEYFIYEVTQ